MLTWLELLKTLQFSLVHATTLDDRSRGVTLSKCRYDISTSDILKVNSDKVLVSVRIVSTIPR